MQILARNLKSNDFAMNNSSCGRDLKDRYEKLYGASKEMRETRTTLKQSKKLLLNQTMDSFGIN